LILNITPVALTGRRSEMDWTSFDVGILAGILLLAGIAVVIVIASKKEE